LFYQIRLSIFVPFNLISALIDKKTTQFLFLFATFLFLPDLSVQDRKSAPIENDVRIDSTDKTITMNLPRGYYVLKIEQTVRKVVFK